MIQLQEDMYLQEGMFVCPYCHNENYYYFEESLAFIKCLECLREVYPHPRDLQWSQILRHMYHFQWKEMQNEQEKSSIKIHQGSNLPC